MIEDLSEEMNSHEPANCSPQELEEYWHLKLLEAHSLYQAATAQYRRMLNQHADGLLPGLDSSLSHARETESQSLAEYMRTLAIFTDLTVHRKAPSEQSNGGLGPPMTALAEAGVISIVDDDESIREATKTLLKSAGYCVGTFTSAEHFLESGALRETECLVLDVRMPGMSGLDLQRQLKSSDSAVPIIFITAHDDNANRRQAIEAGAADFLGKPFEAAALVAAIRTALAGQRSAHQRVTACESGKLTAVHTATL